VRHASGSGHRYGGVSNEVSEVGFEEIASYEGVRSEPSLRPNTLSSHLPTPRCPYSTQSTLEELAVSARPSADGNRSLDQREPGVSASDESLSGELLEGAEMESARGATFNGGL